MKKYLFSFLAIIILIAGYIIFSKNPLVMTTLPAGRTHYTGNDISFYYPESFGANVWKAVTWPPKVTIANPDQDALLIGCPLLKDSAIITQSGEGRSNNIFYTYYQGGDAGAGSLYTTLCYIFSGATANYIIDFDIRSHTGCEHGNCGAYCEIPYEQECKEFDMNKQVIAPIEQIISTVQLIK